MFLEKECDKHQLHLSKLPKIPQIVSDIQTLYSPEEFFITLMKNIKDAVHRIYLVTLYLEKDQGGSKILKTLYLAKKNNPTLEIAILVDLHRARRSKIGFNENKTNADWYWKIAIENPNIDVPVYGVPIGNREALGVLHLKGFILDDKVIYSGANLNSHYLHQLNKYRFDRYKIIRNKILADTLADYLKRYLLFEPSVKRLNKNELKYLKNKNRTSFLRKILKYSSYSYRGTANQNELAITPLVGIGKRNLLNNTIHHLLCSTKKKVIICTPYFNLSPLVKRDVINLLKLGKEVEIIVGDKIANDFYVPENKPFKTISILPYLYEINLKLFLSNFQYFLNQKKLIIRLWKNDRNSFHLKGIWIDTEWQLLTGNNLNLRAWRLDLENALLLHDPKQMLKSQRDNELFAIRSHTKIIQHFNELENISEYPKKVKNLILNLRRIKLDKLINLII